MVLVILAPDEPSHLTLRIAHKHRLDIWIPNEEFRLALRKHLELGLIGWLHKKLITLAPERQDQIRVVDKAVLANKVVKPLWINLELGTLFLLGCGETG